MRRVTLTLPDDLLEAADLLARRDGASRSGFIQRVLAGFLERRRRRELAERMAEGYREMAAESSKLSGEFALAEGESLLAQTAGIDDELDW